jgi:aldose 1-epimerase
MKLLLAGAVLAAAFSAATLAEAAEARREPFGVMADGTPVEAVVLTNRQGIKARVIAYGAVLQSLEAPDRNGQVTNIVLSHPDLAGYVNGRGNLGATIGRYANRIKDATFTLDGRVYKLASTIHGGPRGFDKAVWKIAQVKSGPEASVTLTNVSPDGDQGFPGELKASVTYALDEQGALSLRFEATTDKPTVVNLTNHSYFNLKGSGDVLDHRLTVLSDEITVVDSKLMPSGEFRKVAGTPFDFRTPHTIGERIKDPDPMLDMAKTYDHNFVLRGGATRTPKRALRLEDPTSGRVVELATTEPGVQIYTGNKGGVAIEPQHYPDSPNHANFPSTRLDPGQTYRHVSVYRFSTTR